MLIKETKLPSETIQSKTYTIEVLVAVDKLMIDFYGSNNIEEYVLSLMLFASNNLANIEIGNTIKLAVVDIISLETTLAAYTFYRGTQILGNFSKPLVNFKFRIKNNLSFQLEKNHNFSSQFRKRCESTAECVSRLHTRE